MANPDLALDPATRRFLSYLTLGSVQALAELLRLLTGSATSVKLVEQALHNQVAQT